MTARHVLVVAAVLAALATASSQTKAPGRPPAATRLGTAGPLAQTPQPPQLATAVGKWFLTLGPGGMRMKLLGQRPLVVALAPDGRQTALVFPRRVLFLSGGHVRATAKLPGKVTPPDFLSTYQLVAWSPRSRRIAVPLMLAKTGGQPQLWAVAVNAATGRVTVVARGMPAAWSSGGTGLALMRRSEAPLPCDGKMSCPDSGVFIWSGGKVRRLVSARELWKSGMGDNWPIAWDSRTGKIFFDTTVGYDSGMLVARRASDGRMLWHMVGDFAQQVAPGIFGLAQRGYDTANEITTYAPLLVNETGKVLRRYPPVDHALHYGMPAWSRNLKYLARGHDFLTSKGSASSVIISGPGAYRWEWTAEPLGTEICGYYWAAPKGLVVWTQPPAAKGQAISVAWWLDSGNRAARRLLTVTAPARAAGSPGNATSVCGAPTQGGAIWPAAPGWG